MGSSVCIQGPVRVLFKNTVFQKASVVFRTALCRSIPSNGSGLYSERRMLYTKPDDERFSGLPRGLTVWTDLLFMSVSLLSFYDIITFRDLFATINDDRFTVWNDQPLKMNWILIVLHDNISMKSHGIRRSLRHWPPWLIYDPSKSVWTIQYFRLSFLFLRRQGRDVSDEPCSNYSAADHRRS